MDITGLRVEGEANFASEHAQALTPRFAKVPESTPACVTLMHALSGVSGANSDFVTLFVTSECRLDPTFVKCSFVVK